MIAFYWFMKCVFLGNQFGFCRQLVRHLEPRIRWCNPKNIQKISIPPPEKGLFLRPPPPTHLSGNSNHVSYINLRFYVTLLCYVVLCYVMLCYVMLCYEMKWNEMKWNDMLCYVMLCYVMLCYVMLCNVSNVM